MVKYAREKYYDFRVFGETKEFMLPWRTVSEAKVTLKRLMETYPEENFKMTIYHPFR